MAKTTKNIEPPSGMSAAEEKAALNAMMPAGLSTTEELLKPGYPSSRIASPEEIPAILGSVKYSPIAQAGDRTINWDLDTEAN